MDKSSPSVSEVKTLSKRQQRRSLGGATPKKSPKPLKNQSPSASTKNPQFLTTLVEEKSKALLSQTKILIRSFKYPFSKNIPLAQIRQIPKSERSAYREKWLKEQCSKNDFSLANLAKLRSSVSIGINACSKSLEQNNLLFILVDSDVKPFRMIELLGQIAKTKDVPVVSLVGFNNMFRFNGGMKCIAFGLKVQCGQTDNYFYPLVQYIQNQLSDVL